MQHDKHTYYFEKYLRNEMSREEKEAFELKLNNDIDFKSDFTKYALNHDKIIKAELAEYYDKEIIPDKPKNYSWVWVLFSVLGLVLIIDYYANQKYNEGQKSNQTYKEAFVNRFKNAFVEPFKKITFKDKNKNNNNQQTTIRADENADLLEEIVDTNNIQVVDSNLIEEKIIQQFQQLMNDKNAFTNIKDIFLNDSLMSVIELEKFKEKYKLIKTSTDSILEDSLVTKLTLQSLSKQSNNIKPLFVEFWQSLVGFSGYQFTGKKLIIYGIQKPFDVFILKQNTNFILHTKWSETALEPDNLLHKFEN
ncbi:MAG: hypothetical protein K9G64_04075 [Bacteroidia bacterium]|nr:hypothetical protein [Bacteroidia bacterium]